MRSHFAARALLTLWPDRPRFSLRTIGSRDAGYPLRSLDTWITFFSLRSHRACCTSGSLLTGLTAQTWQTLCALGALGAFRPNGSRESLLALRSDRANGTRWALRSFVSLRTLWSDRPCQTLLALWPDATGVAFGTLLTLWAGITYVTFFAVRSHGPCWSS